MMDFQNDIIVYREGHDPVKVGVSIKGKHVRIEVEKDKELRFLDISKYLIEETPLLTLKYERFCPYKLNVLKISGENGFSHRQYSLEFLKIDTNNLVVKSINIINLYTTNFKLRGTVTCFIPDLLLVMEERKYVKKINDDTFVPARNFNLNMSYRDNLLNVERLKSKGYIIPDKFLKRLSTLDPKDN